MILGVWTMAQIASGIGGQEHASYYINDIALSCTLILSRYC